MSAGPPTRYEVWRASGAAGRVLPPSRARSASSRSGGSESGMLVDGGHRGAGPEEREQFVAGAMDVARPESEHEVAGTDDLEQRFRHALARRDVAHVQVPAPAERLAA